MFNGWSNGPEVSGFLIIILAKLPSALISEDTTGVPDPVDR